MGPTLDITLSVRPHPSEKRAGFNVIISKTIRFEGETIQDSFVLRSFRRVKSDENHRKMEANEYAISLGKLLGIKDIQTL